jgi:hypothetical protein
MPIEIRELVIKVTIEDHKGKKAVDAKDLHELKNKVVKECVDKVLAKLESISER